MRHGGGGRTHSSSPHQCIERLRADASVLSAVITEEELIRKQVHPAPLPQQSPHGGCWPATFPGGGVLGEPGDECVAIWRWRTGPWPGLPNTSRLQPPHSMEPRASSGSRARAGLPLGTSCFQTLNAACWQQGLQSPRKCHVWTWRWGEGRPKSADVWGAIPEKQEEGTRPMPPGGRAGMKGELPVNLQEAAGSHPRALDKPALSLLGRTLSAALPWCLAHTCAH